MRFVLTIITSTLIFHYHIISGESTNSNQSEHESGPHLIGLDYEGYKSFLALSVFMLCVAATKVIYSRLHFISYHLPESCMLIIMGIIIAVFVKFVFKGIPVNFKLTPDIFFKILLPPIVLESAYCLYTKTFFNLLTIILIFAVIGTVLNFIFIGALLNLFYQMGLGPPLLHLNLKSLLLFGALIVAVDPVAVLAIFQDIGVDLELYFIVFGESLLNDAVTIVLYDIIEAFMNKEEILQSEVIIGFLSFFTVSLGGLFIGIVIGALSCIIIRIESHYQYLILIASAYIAYIAGMMVKWSGIISMIGCGLVQARYGFRNMFNESVSLLRHVTETLATISEAMIFFYLGTSLLDRTLYWHTGFCLSALMLCIVARFLITLFLSAIINFFEINYRHITYSEQFILFYGGLRGAVSFSLCVLIEPEMMPGSSHEEKLLNAELFFTATMFIVIFTVGIMGTSMKPLVRLLGIKMSGEDINSTLIMIHATIKSIEYTNDALEVITGFKEKQNYQRMFSNFDNNYVSSILTCNEQRLYSGLDIYAINSRPALLPVYSRELTPSVQMESIDADKIKSIFSESLKVIKVNNIHELGQEEEHKRTVQFMNRVKVFSDRHDTMDSVSIDPNFNKSTAGAIMAYLSTTNYRSLSNIK